MPAWRVVWLAICGAGGMKTELVYDTDRDTLQIRIFTKSGEEFRFTGKTMKELGGKVEAFQIGLTAEAANLEWGEPPADSKEDG